MKFFVDINNFLFKGWASTDIPSLLGICIFSGVLALCVEIIAVGAVYLHKQANVDPLHYGQATGDDEQRPESIRPLLIPSSLSQFRTRKMCYHAVQSLVRMLHLLMGYILMLAIMTYNAWIAISVIIGSFLGYFFFGWMRVSMLNPDMSTDPRCEDSPSASGCSIEQNATPSCSTWQIFPRMLRPKKILSFSFLMILAPFVFFYFFSAQKVLYDWRRQIVGVSHLNYTYPQDFIPSDNSNESFLPTNWFF